MKRTIASLAVIAGLAFAGSAQATACNGVLGTPGYHDAYSSKLDVYVSSYHGMTCPRALRVGAAAYLHPGLRPIFGPQFGGGGYGGPFHVGHLPCWLYMRGSDFLTAKCWSGHEYVKFGDERDY